MKELFTAVYLDNYLIVPKKNGYEDMITLVRETGSCYYSDSQVENGAADGAYAKSEKTQKYYSNSLEMEANEWIRLQWDYSHLVNKADDDANAKNPAINKHLDLAQGITKCFRWGKEYSHMYVTNEIDRCVSLADHKDTDKGSVSEMLENASSNISAPYAPVVQS